MSARGNYSLDTNKKFFIIKVIHIQQKNLQIYQPFVFSQRIVRKQYSSRKKNVFFPVRVFLRIQRRQFALARPQNHDPPQHSRSADILFYTCTITHNTYIYMTASDVRMRTTNTHIYTQLQTAAAAHMRVKASLADLFGARI